MNIKNQPTNQPTNQNIYVYMYEGWQKSSETDQDNWFVLVWFYGISIIVGYLMPNSLFTYTLKI